jgi:hypothetical protein
MRQHTGYMVFNMINIHFFASLVVLFCSKQKKIFIYILIHYYTYSICLFTFRTHKSQTADNNNVRSNGLMKSNFTRIWRL